MISNLSPSSDAFLANINRVQRSVEEASRQVLDELAPRFADDVRFQMSKDRHVIGILTITGRGADKGRALQVALPARSARL